MDNLSVKVLCVVTERNLKWNYDFHIGIQRSNLHYFTRRFRYFTAAVIREEMKVYYYY